MMTGKFKGASGSALCTDCPAGTYQDTAGDAKVGVALDASLRRKGHLFAYKVTTATTKNSHRLHTCHTYTQIIT